MVKIFFLANMKTPTAIIVLLLVLIATFGLTMSQTAMLRLDKTIYPKEYKVQFSWESDFLDTRKYWVDETIEIVVKSEVEVSEFKIHFAMPYSEEVKSKIMVLDENFFPTREYTVAVEELPDEIIGIYLEDDIKLQPGLTYFLRFEGLEGVFGSGLYGINLREIELNGQPEFVIDTNFKPTYARKAFPCFDEPGFKAKFAVVTKRPFINDTVATSNNNQHSQQIIKDEDEYPIYFVDNFDGAVMAPYQLTLLVSKFSNTSHPQFIQWIYFLEDQLNDTQMQYLLYHSADFTSEFQRYTDVTYYDTGNRRMGYFISDRVTEEKIEYWGLSSFRNDDFLVSEKDASVRFKQDAVTTIGNNIVRMWFGNMLTPDWWTDLWLSEGFATFFQYFPYGKITADWDMDQQFILEELQLALEQDVGTLDPLSSPVLTRGDLRNKFGGLLGPKGAAVVRMLNYTYGEYEFQMSIRKFLKKGRENFVVTPQHLWESFPEIDGLLPMNHDIESVMTKWIDNPGYPIVYVQNRSVDAHLTQKRFKIQNGNGEVDYKWTIPINYATADYNSNFLRNATITWFLESADKFVIPNAFYYNNWIVVNIQQMGYYRVNYSKGLWLELASLLKRSDFGGIPPMSRAQIVDDILHLALIEEVDYDTTFEIISYLRFETDYYPLYAAHRSFKYLIDMYRNDDEMYGYLRTYIAKLLSLTLGDIDFTTIDKNADITHIEILRVVLILQWTCELNFWSCSVKAEEIFEEYKILPYNAINPNLRKIVYCNGIKEGTAEDWSLMRGKLGESNLPSEADNIRKSLACTKNAQTLMEYLLESLGDEPAVIKEQNRLDIFRDVLEADVANFGTVLDFFVNNFDKIQEKYFGANTVNSIIKSFNNKFTTSEQVAKLEKFVVDNELKLEENTIELTRQMTKSSMVMIEAARSDKSGIREWFLKNNSIKNSVYSSFTILASICVIYLINV